jgi:hypothetical protein
MKEKERRVLTLTVLGFALVALATLFIMSRTSDLSIVGILVGIAIAVVFFPLSAYLTPSELETPAIGTVKLRRPTSLTRPTAVGFLAMSVIISSIVLATFADAYNFIIALLRSYDELVVKTSRASFALQAVVGGQLFFLFMLPFICIAAFWVGTRAGQLSFKLCLLSVLISLGLFVVLNLVLEFWQGTLSIELVMSSIFNEPEHSGPRLFAEKGALIFLMLCLLAVLSAIIAALQWMFVKLGSRYSWVRIEQC